MLQSHNRFAYVMNNPLNLTDPSGFSWWTKWRGTFVRAIAAVADTFFGCSGYCSAAVGAYQGAQNGGGLRGAVVGGVTSYFGYQYAGDFSAAGFAVSAASGCASAAVSGGNCGRGAVSGGIGHFGSQFGFSGTVAAGCVSSRINGGSCGAGARDAATSYAINYVVKGAVAAGREIYADAEQADAGQRRPVQIACFPFCAGVGLAPEVVSFGTILWRATVAYFGALAIVDTAKHVNALSVNEAEGAKGADSGTKPEAAPTEKPPSDADRAKDLGYDRPVKDPPFNPHGQKVFGNGKDFITPDVDGHNVSDGWKGFDRRGNRTGTYDKDLNWIKK
jgi:hypothetical protein